MPACFALDAKLRADCHLLGRLPLCHVLLMNKAEVPWFILVPETTVIELCDLSDAEQQRLQVEINRLSRLVRQAFSITKLNVAAIGNLVPQLHIHIIGRHRDDPWWPQVAWGQTSAGGYAPDKLSAIAALLTEQLGGEYRPA